MKHLHYLNPKWRSHRIKQTKARLTTAWWTPGTVSGPAVSGSASDCVSSDSASVLSEWCCGSSGRTVQQVSDSALWKHWNEVKWSEVKEGLDKCRSASHISQREVTQLSDSLSDWEAQKSLYFTLLLLPHFIICKMLLLFRNKWGFMYNLFLQKLSTYLTIFLFFNFAIICNVQSLKIKDSIQHDTLILPP